MKYIWNFCLFWWDFIVGDSITLAIGGGIAILAAWGLAHATDTLAAELTLPAVVLVTRGLSLRR